MDRTAGRSVTSVNKRGPKSAGQITVGLARLGDLAQARGETAAALELYTRSQTLLEDLATTDPDNTTYRRDLETLGEWIRFRATAQ